MAQDVVEIRLTPTQYEKLLLYAFIGNYVESYNGKVKKPDEKLLTELMILGRVKGITSIEKKENSLTLNKTQQEKMVSILERYDNEVFKEMLEDLKKDN